MAGAAVAAVPVIESHAAASRSRRRWSATAQAKVGAVEVGLFDRRIALIDMQVDQRRRRLTVGRWEASGLAWPLGELMAGRTPLAGFRWGDPLQAGQYRAQGRAAGRQGDRQRWRSGSLVVEGFDLGALSMPAYARRATSFSRCSPRASWGRSRPPSRAERNVHLHRCPAPATRSAIASVAIDGYDAAASPR